MSRMTRLLGTVSVLATLAAGPAAADTLMGFAGMGDLSYVNTGFDNDVSDDNLNTFGVGAAIAFPVDEIAGFNWELNASYYSSSFTDFSQITWNLGGSLFWAGPGSRTGVNINYNTITDFGSATNGGLFTEWYLGNFTVQAKGGWLWGGGTPAAGRGNYLGGGAVAYFIPNLAISAAASWADLVTSATYGEICYGATCGRRDASHVDVGVEAEFLVSEEWPISIYGGYQWTQFKLSDNASNPLVLGRDNNVNTFFVGLRYYMGAGGTLIDQHRNGNLHGFLRGPSGLAPAF